MTNFCKATKYVFHNRKIIAGKASTDVLRLDDCIELYFLEVRKQKQFSYIKDFTLLKRQTGWLSGTVQFLCQENPIPISVRTTVLLVFLQCTKVM